MHKVQMNSGGFNPETVKKRIACFEEFDNGHVLRSYEKMSVADSEERARKASINDPENVYYVAYDNIMEPSSDLYWFQGKSYDSERAEQALSQYRKSGTSGLNSGRKSLNSSDEQVRVIGTVTIYSDFVDFKQSVSEHLLQTAVGSKAKLKFKWLGDNKVEVRAICSADDERKVKILLENSDVTKTIAWATSGNSGRRRQLGLNSGCGDLVKKSTATLKRKLKDASPEEKKAILAELNARGVYPKTSVNSAENSPVGPCFVDLWSAYIDDEYKCACCGKPFPAGHNSVSLGGHKPDGMHFIFDYTKENRVGNGVNYDPYNLPPEDSEGGIFKVIVGEEADDEGYHWLNFCRNCWPKLTSMSPEEIYAKYSPSANSSKSCNSSATCFVDTNGIMGIPGDTWTLKELAEYWNSEQGSDPCLDEYASFDDWVEDTISMMTPLDSSRKLNSANDPESPFYTSTDAANYFLGKDYTVEQIERYLKRKGYSDEWIRNMFDLMDEYADEQEDFDMFNSSRKNINSNRKVGNSSMRKVVFRGKLNSSHNLNSAAGNSDVTAVLKTALAKASLPNDFNYTSPRRRDDGILTTLTVKLPDGTQSWADKCYIEGDLATGDWAFESYAPAGHNPAADTFGVQATSGLDTEEKAVAWLTKQLEDCAKFYKDNPPKRIARVLDSSRKPAQRAARKKLNSAAGSGFEKYFNRVTDQQLADFYGIPVEDMLEVNKDIEDANYGKVVGHYIPKDEYAEVLCDGDWDTLDILEDGTVGFALGEGGGKATRFYGVDIDTIEEAIAEAGLDSSRKLNSSEEEPGEPAEGVAADGSAAEGVDADGVTAEDDVQDTGIDGGETAVETAELLEDALIVQNPETKEVSLFVATEEDEALPEFVDVIAEITPVAEAEILDSSRRLKKFATAKLNSSKGCLNSDAEDVCPGCGNLFDECTCEAGTVAYDEIQLPDDSVVEVENILVVKGEDDDLGLFMPDDADDTVPEDYEVVAIATPVAEVEVLDSSRRLKKAGKASKLNSAAKSITGASIVREALKAVVGPERYSKLIIYVNKRANDYRVKVEQTSWSSITDTEVDAVVKYIQDNYPGDTVKVEKGQSGGRVLKFVAFIID